MAMINKAFFQNLKKKFDEQTSERRQICALANVVLHDSKRVIFSLHRKDVKKAEESLNEIESILKKLAKQFGIKRINDEGAYSAAVEEYAEAKLFYNVITGKGIDKIKGIDLNFESYLGGICDLTGELVRRAINEAAEGHFDQVGNIKKIINEIMAELIIFDMTGYLRTKYDQAKGNLRKIEQIDYEIKLKK